MEQNHGLVPFAEMKSMAHAIAVSNFFGVKTPEQALALMLVAQAEGRHPASVAMDYHIIQGRPALKADAMLARFQAAGGKVKWVSMTDEKVSAIFSHASSGDVEITWDMARAGAAELLSKNGGMFKKYPRQMLRARVISEGVRASFPGVLGGFYAPEEVELFDGKPEQKGTQTVIDAPKPEPEKPKTNPRVAINSRVKGAMLKLGWDKSTLDNLVRSRTRDKVQLWEKLDNEVALAMTIELEAEAASATDK